MLNTIMMLDHPSWLIGEDGRARRAFRSAGSVWSVTCTPRSNDGTHAIDLALVAGETDSPPVVDVFDPSVLDGPHPICDALRADGVAVSRVRNPSLWEALATSVIRQVIRAGQARKLCRSFCSTYGEQVETPSGPAWLFPTPETVLALSDNEIADLGLKFFRHKLRACAEACQKFGHDWAELHPVELVDALQTIRGIGPWSAGATVADATNTYSLYPFADLAVRTWAKALMPSIRWPEEENVFGPAWQALAGEQLSELTLLTLAWGVRHANGVAL